MRHHETTRWALILVGIAAACLTSTSCDSSCTATCDEQHDDCVDRAPPGASKQDCDAEYNQCLARCDASAS